MAPYSPPTKAVIGFSPAHFLSFSADYSSWLTILLPTPAHALPHDFNIHGMTHPLPPSTLSSSPPLLSATGFQGAHPGCGHHQKPRHPRMPATLGFLCFPSFLAQVSLSTTDKFFIFIKNIYRPISSPGSLFIANCLIVLLLIILPSKPGRHIPEKLNPA